MKANTFFGIVFALLFLAAGVSYCTYRAFGQDAQFAKQIAGQMAGVAQEQATALQAQARAIEKSVDLNNTLATEQIRYTRAQTLLLYAIIIAVAIMVIVMVGLAIAAGRRIRAWKPEDQR